MGSNIIKYCPECETWWDTKQLKTNPETFNYCPTCAHNFKG